MTEEERDFEVERERLVSIISQLHDRIEVLQRELARLS